MSDYYSENLSSDRLQLCYELAPARVKQYLQSEIDFVLEMIRTNNSVLELGCGYGRVLSQLTKKSDDIWGIDTSLSSLRYAKKYINNLSKINLCTMNAISLGFYNNTFDIVLCLQNGLSAFKENPHISANIAIRSKSRPVPPAQKS